MTEQASNVVRMPEKASFEDFWRVYPKRVQKAIAKAKWDAITGEGLTTRTLDKDSGGYIELELKASPDEIIEAARSYAKSQREPHSYSLRDNGKYTCNPATWLNQGRWMDEG